MRRRGIVALAAFAFGAAVVPVAVAQDRAGTGELKLCAVGGVAYGGFWADGPSAFDAPLTEAGCVVRAVEPGPYRIGIELTSFQRPCGYGTDAVDKATLERPGLFRTLTAGRLSAREFEVTVASGKPTRVTYQLQDSCLPGR
ncbi:MAG: hypothetical protein ACT4QF_22375 [Sporichthyaceae bacterium]